MTTQSLVVHLRTPHAEQERFRRSPAKRKVIRAGRRSGKTVGVSILAVDYFLQGKRVLYTAPTGEQTDRFWYEVCRSLAEPIEAGIFRKNETERTIERVGTETRIKAKTAWNANTLRGDYGDLLILDEWQLMAEDTWEEVGAPLLLDNNGDAVFVYTPPSLRSTGVSKATDPRHAAKMFQSAHEDKTGRWETFHFTSFDNPYISQDALRDITQDMTQDAYHKEIMAEDDDLQTALLVYAPFNERTQKIPRFPIPATWLRFVGHDFGSANPAALFFAQDPATGLFYAYQEYLPGAGKSTAQNVEEFKRLTAGSTVLKRVGGSHQEDEIRQGYSAHGWQIQEPNIRSVNAQVDRVRGMMELNKLFVFNDLYHYLAELSNCMWKLDEQGKATDVIKDEAKYHLCASARYLLSDFVPETVVRSPSAQIQRFDGTTEVAGARRL